LARSHMTRRCRVVYNALRPFPITRPYGESMNNKLPTRRMALSALGGTALGAMAAPGLHAGADDHRSGGNKNRIKQSVCRWCYAGMPLEKLAAETARMGFKSIELLTIEEYGTIKPFGLTCAMLGRVSITDGLNRKQYHARIEKELRRNIEFAAAEGLP